MTSADPGKNPAAAARETGRDTVRPLIRSLRGRLAGSTSIITVTMALRLFMQMFTLLIVAGSMGAGQFGAFVSVAALSGILSAFAGWGSDQLVVRRVAREPAALPEAMATGLAFMGLSVPPLVLLALGVVPWIVDRSIPLQLVLLIAIADIGCSRINNYAASCFQAAEQPLGTARLSLIFAGLRIAAALLWVALPIDHDALSWSHFYVAASVLAAAHSIDHLRRILGPFRWRVDWREWRDGGHFSIQLASFLAFGNLDKPMIAAMAGLSVAGLYAAAFRVADAAVTPVRALLYSTYPAFFRAGSQGLGDSVGLALRLLPVGIGLGAVGSLGVLILAPLAPRLLGHGYHGSETVLLALAPLPVLYAIYYLGADVLVSCGHTGLRTLAQVAMPPVNFLLLWLLVPAYGALGAAMAAVLTNVILAAAAWSVVGVLVWLDARGISSGRVDSSAATGRPAGSLP